MNTLQRIVADIQQQHNVTQREISEASGYKNQSSFSIALKRERMPFNRFKKMCDHYGVELIVKIPKRKEKRIKL